MDHRRQNQGNAFNESYFNRGTSISDTLWRWGATAGNENEWTDWEDAVEQPQADSRYAYDLRTIYLQVLQ